MKPLARCRRSWPGMVALVLAGSAPAASRPAPFEPEIRAFEAADRTNAPPRGATLFVGSSSIRRWTTLARDFPGRTVINRGFGGSQMTDLLAYTDRIVLPYAPRTIVVYEGDNDLPAGRTPADIARGFGEFARRVHAALPDAHIAFISIKPSLQRQKWMPHAALANTQIEKLCAREPWLSYIDVFTPMLDDGGRPRRDLFATDRLHLNAKGYEVWAQVVREHLARLGK